MGEHFYYIELNGQKIEVTEEVYRAYKRPAWAEGKRREREKRCFDEKGCRCLKDCSACPRQRTGTVLSLEGLFEDHGYQIADPVDIEELITDQLLLEELFAALEELDPDNRRIMELFSRGQSEREIAADIGLSQKAVNKRKAKLLKELRVRLKNIF